MSTRSVGKLSVASAILVWTGLWICLPAGLAVAEQVQSDGASGSTESATAQIDALVEQSWKANGVRPAKEARDHVWCRRVFLDLIGRIPTVDELEAFANANARDRDVALVDRLLGSDYVDEYARHWSTIWANTLIGRTGGGNRRDPTSREGMSDYLRRSFLENKPYDLLCRELVEAEGGARPGMENYNGAVNFLIGKLEEDGVQATAKTAQIFLGMAVQCTQCHNHPFNEYRQNQFWELNAFFRQTRVRTNSMDREARMRYSSLVESDFRGEGRMIGGDTRREVFLEMRDGKLVDRDQASVNAAPTYYELRNGQVQVAYPVFVDGQSLTEKFADRGAEFGNSGRLSDVDRRGELVEYVLASEHFEQARVNRIWAHFFGYGFTKPIDDMGPHNPPSHPELLDELARSFRNGGFDLKSLLRSIALSKPYRLSSRITQDNKEDDPELGRPPLFSRFYLRQMQPEQLYESLLTATRADATASDDDRDALRARWLSQFTTAFGNDEQIEASSFNGSIPQTLMMMNGELVKRACRIEGGSFLDKIANDPNLTDREKMTYLYKAGLSRPPGSDERNICNQLLAARGGDVAAALQDVWWAVLNSNEFIFVH
ncbi:DUF1549 and DUF1553 domain-containing protein [Pirellulales bacterium]|nr:DUF1549 and DUF1553 domain-containing protein [Pirellulales bacterium]